MSNVARRSQAVNNALAPGVNVMVITMPRRRSYVRKSLTLFRIIHGRPVQTIEWFSFLEHGRSDSMFTSSATRLSRPCPGSSHLNSGVNIYLG